MAVGLPPLPPLAQLPPLPPVPSLPQLPPLGPAVGQPGATSHRRRHKKATRPRDDETDELAGELAGDDEDPAKATSGAVESERAPVSNPDPLQSPLAARFDSDSPPRRSAGTPPQERR
jgi:hypothetical protein